MGTAAGMGLGSGVWASTGAGTGGRAGPVRWVGGQGDAAVGSRIRRSARTRAAAFQPHIPWTPAPGWA